IRVVLAALITLLVLPYGWGATLVTGMMDQPGRQYVVATAVVIAAVLGLTLGAATAFPPRSRWWIGLALAGAWLYELRHLVVLYFSSLILKLYVGPLMVLATLWVLWAAWILFWPVRWLSRIGILMFLLLASAAFPLLLRVEGLTGATEVNFVWR